MKFLSPGRRVIKHILINNLTFLTASTHGWAKDFVLSLQSASKYQRNCLDQRECEDCLCGGETPVCDIDLGCNRLSQDLSLYSSVLQVSSANTVAVLSDFPKQLGSAVQNSCFRHPCGTNCGFHVWLWCNASRPISLHAVIFVLSLVTLHDGVVHEVTYCVRSKWRLGEARRQHERVSSPNPWWDFT